MKFQYLISSEGMTTLQKSLFSHTYLCDSSLFFWSKRMKTIQTIKTAIIFLLFLIIKLIIFLLKNNVILLHLESLKKWLVFHALSYVLKRRLRAIFRLFFSGFFQSCFPYGKFIPSQLYLSIKGLVFIFW